MQADLPFRQVIGIHSVPRSGSSWLGQIFNSHPDVAYRYQPLFAYAFKDRLAEVQNSYLLPGLLEDIYRSNDPFIHQKGDARLGLTPDFTVKNQTPPCLALKMVRFHNLLPNFLELPSYKCVALIRDPRAVINSFLNTPREWREGWDPLSEWRSANLKNQEHPYNCFGFNSWIDTTKAFLKLQQQFPNRFLVVRYETLVSNTSLSVKKIFDFVGLSWHAQTASFLHESSKSQDLTHDHGVYKSPTVVDRWQDELPPQIAQNIANEAHRNGLARFLFD